MRPLHARAYRRVGLLMVLTVGVLTIGSWAGITDRSAATASAATRNAQAVRTVQGPRAWDPQHHRKYAHRSTVTVSQTTNVVDQVVTVSWTHFTPTGNGSGAYPTSSDPYPLMIYQCTGTKVTKRRDCIGTSEWQRAEHKTVGDVGNSVVAATRSDGTGQVQIAIRTRASDPQLACDSGHPCSIVIEPEWGGRPGGPDGWGGVTPAKCSDHSDDQDNATLNDLASPQLALHACSWADRITVPIRFAPTVSDCPSAATDLTLEGSPMAQRELAQWASGLCTGAGGAERMHVNPTDIDEYTARTLFTSASGPDPAIPLTTQPINQPGSRRHTYAPIGVSAVAVAYVIDNVRTRKPVTHLVLDARLLAKMLTQSYADGLSCPSTNYACDPGVTGNPDSVFDDPEFRRLNPSYKPSDFESGTMGADFPVVVGDNSDMTYELTRWIAADPRAEAFLRGHPDPWGMHVNPCYMQKRSKQCGGAQPYPISSFLNNSPDQTLKTSATNCGQAQCFNINGGMRYIWNPVHGVQSIAATVLANKTSAQTAQAQCPDATEGWLGNKCFLHPAADPQFVGSRAIFAIMPYGDAAAYGLHTAELVTRSGAPVGPTNRSMRAALADMTTDPNGVTKHLDFRTLHNRAAYPLTMPIYAGVPTCGIAPHTANSLAGFLDFVAHSPRAQTSGFGPGQLAPGYLPLSPALKTQDRRAAAAVMAAGPCKAAASGPAPTPAPSGPAPSSAPIEPAPPTEPLGGTPAPTGSGAPAPVATESRAAVPPTVVPVSAAPTAAPTPNTSAGSAASTSSAALGAAAPPNASPTTPAVQPVAFGTPLPNESSPSTVVLPVALAIGALLLLVGPVLYILGRTGAAPELTARLRAIRHLGLRR